MNWNFSLTSFRYLLFELLPSFIIGNLVFIFVILMFQGLKFAEFALIHGVGGRTLVEILFYMTISLLPAILPMSLLFSVVMTFARLSSDSEIVALRASGLSLTQIMLPVFLLGTLTSYASAQLAFDIAPWGNRKFEVLISQLGNTKAAINLKEGTFMEGFFDMVVYASKVHPESGELDHIFIYDERQNPPITIIAKKGFMSQNAQLTGQQVQLELHEGDIHRKTTTHTKINFGKFFISLNENYQLTEKDKTLQSMSLDELKKSNQSNRADAKTLRSYEVEYHRRIAISFACILFALLGSALGIKNQTRSSRGSGLVVALTVIVLYWVLFVTCEATARAVKAPVALLLWIPNVLFAIATARTLIKQSR